MRRTETAERKDNAKVGSCLGMEKAVQQVRKNIDGVSKLFTLGACRRRGKNGLEEAD